MHLTQKELAEKVTNVQRNVSNWESGASEPDCETIIKLADIFDITIDELFGRVPLKVEQQLLSGIDHNILKCVRGLNEKQKMALMQFLKTLNIEN